MRAELALCLLGPELQTLVAKKTSVVSWAMAYSALPLQQALINVKKELQGDEEKKEKGSDLIGDWGKGSFETPPEDSLGWGEGTAPGSLRTKSIGPEQDKGHGAVDGCRFSSALLRMVGNISRCEKT